MIDLQEEYIEFIKKTVSLYLSDYKLYMFGSRVKNRAHKYSDIDLAIQSKELNNNIKSKLMFEFENSTIPYEIDIIDLRQISETFKNLIEADLVELV